MADLVPWEPFRELEDMGRMVNRIFGKSLLQRRPALDVLERGAWSPAVDIYDKKDSLVVKVEIPGADKKDVKLSVEGDVLNIRGEIEKEQETGEKDYYCCERTYGSFYRAVSLPVAVQRDKIKASFKNGIVTINLPKTKEAQLKEINIEIE